MRENLLSFLRGRSTITTAAHSATLASEPPPLANPARSLRKPLSNSTTTALPTAPPVSFCHPPSNPLPVECAPPTAPAARSHTVESSTALSVCLILCCLMGNACQSVKAAPPSGQCASLPKPRLSAQLISANSVSTVALFAVAIASPISSAFMEASALPPALGASMRINRPGAVSLATPTALTALHPLTALSAPLSS